MKIAVCYSGLPRTILNCLDNHYENLLKDNLCDIYFSFWDTWGFNFREDTLKKEENISKEDISNLINLLKPKRFEFEKFENFNDYFEKKTIDSPQGYPYCKNLLSMHYKIFKTFNLIDMSENYDVILRLRPDHFFKNKIKFEFPKQNTIYTSLTGARCNNGGMNDQIAYGDYDVMKIYSSFFLDWEKIKEIKKTCNPEHLLKYYLDKNNIEYINNESIDHWILNQDNSLR